MTVHLTMIVNQMTFVSTTESVPAYGLWTLVVINSLVFIIFAFSFIKPKTASPWRSLGAFSAFIVALFSEMYGFPLTIFLLSGWLSNQFPGVDFFSHNAGHLLETIFGWQSNPHFGPFHILSNILIFAGFILLATSWRVLYQAQRTHTLATTGPYAHIRHPQYLGLVLIMLGFLLQWPTILTLAMFPVLVWMYVRLARREEAEVKGEFGEIWDAYAQRTPAFIPRWRSRVEALHEP
jgi:protein-S-isoprenylcysteine O-methyltransferase Ste14